jgi:class 3 adenylate cyclase
MADEERVERRLLLSVDARGYGSAPGRMHGEIQRGLLKVLDEAAREAGLRREAWDRQSAGDGELAVLPRKEPEVRVVERFPRELRGALFRLNRDRKDEARLRLRLAVHFGVAKPGPNGYQGPGPVVLSRLCDSGPLKRVLMESGADLAVVFSRQIYADTIASGLTLLDPAELCRVRVRNKEFDEDAWIWVPGRDGREHAWELGEGAEPSTVRPAPPPSPHRGPGPELPYPGSPSARGLPRGGSSPGGAVAHDVFRGVVVPAAQPRGLPDRQG